MMGILNNPHLNENAKVAELRKAIADLPDAEKKDLHERLKDRKSHDPLAQQFHYRLSHHPYKAGGVSTTDQVLNALKPAGSKSQAPTQDSRSAAPGKGSSPSVTDAKTADARARDPILGQDETGHHESPSRNSLRFLQANHQGSGGGLDVRRGSGRELGGVRAGAADRPRAAVDPDPAAPTLHSTRCDHPGHLIFRTRGTIPLIQLSRRHQSSGSSGSTRCSSHPAAFRFAMVGDRQSCQSCGEIREPKYAVI